MKKIKKPLSCLLLMVFFAAPLAADMKELKQRMVESEENTKRQEPEEEKPDTRTELQKEADSRLFLAILRLWFFLNVSVDYDDHPYATGRYVRYGREPETRKTHRFSVGSDLFIARNAGAGFQALFEGKIFPLLGPRFEVTSLFDGAEQLHIACLGGTVSLFQSSWLSADLYVQWTAMRGLLDRNGTAGGLILTSYPFKPIGITATIGSRSYTSGLSMSDFSIAAARHFGRTAAYVGWKSSSAPEFAIQGPFIGLKAHY